MTKKPCTVIVTEIASPFPPAYDRPLIYYMLLADPDDSAAVLRRVAIERFNDIVGTFDEYDPQDDDESVIAEMIEGLRLEFIFAGEPEIASDYRL